MVVAAHYGTGLNNEPKARSRAGAHIFLSENYQVPRWNGPILMIAQTIRFVMYSAAEAELGGLFIAAKEMVPIQKTLIELVWPHCPCQHHSCRRCEKYHSPMQDQVHGPDTPLDLLPYGTRPI